MSISRMLAAGALLALGVMLVSVPACIVANDFDNGEDCIRSEECASKLCVASKCIGQNGDICQSDDKCATGHCDQGHCRAEIVVLDSGLPSDGTVLDSTPAESGADTDVDAVTDGGVDSGVDSGIDSGVDTATGTDTAVADTNDASTDGG